MNWGMKTHYFFHLVEKIQKAVDIFSLTLFQGSKWLKRRAHSALYLLLPHLYNHRDPQSVQPPASSPGHVNLKDCHILRPQHHQCSLWWLLVILGLLPLAGTLDGNVGHVWAGGVIVSFTNIRNSGGRGFPVTGRCPHVTLVREPY